MSVFTHRLVEGDFDGLGRPANGDDNGDCDGDVDGDAAFDTTNGDAIGNFLHCMNSNDIDVNEEISMSRSPTSNRLAIECPVSGYGVNSEEVRG